jgi:rhodanese-related sulfurtransferase
MTKVKTMSFPPLVVAFALSAGCGSREEPAMAVASEAPASGAVAAATAAPEGRRVRVKELGVPEVAALVQAGTAVILDANGPSTRASQGIVPGARCLSSSSQYDVERELPGDKNQPLVFYCGSSECTASDTAAERAIAAGYTDVAVMRPGIAGWKAAGHPTEAPPPT